MSTLLISHIPKTAGTSLRNLIIASGATIEWAYGGHLAIATPDTRYCTGFRERSDKPAAIYGHFGYGVHRLLDLEPRYVCCLREPQGRMVSLLRHKWNEVGSPTGTMMKGGRRVGELVRSGLRAEFNNHMCRMIAGVGDDAGTIIHDSWLLDLALHNLRRHYLHVGTTDRPAAYCEAVMALLDLPFAPLPKDNLAGEGSPDFDGDAMDAIREMNQLDRRLYEIVTNGDH